MSHDVTRTLRRQDVEGAHKAPRPTAFAPSPHSEGFGPARAQHMLPWRGHVPYYSCARDCGSLVHCLRSIQVCTHSIHRALDHARQFNSMYCRYVTLAPAALCSPSLGCSEPEHTLVEVAQRGGTSEDHASLRDPVCLSIRPTHPLSPRPM